MARVGRDRRRDGKPADSGGLGVRTDWYVGSRRTFRRADVRVAGGRIGRRMVGVVVLAAGSVLAGCAAPGAARPLDRIPTTQPQSLPSDAEQLRSDPLAYLRGVGRRCAALAQYTLTFTRQERRGLGLFKTMHEPERIACRFRRQPFSVYMKWLDPDVKYGESVYVAGVADDKVRFVPRHGLFGLPPTITRVDLQTPVTWGEARYPLTDFGLERMMARTLATLDRAAGHVRIRYLGLARVPQRQRWAHALRFEFDEGIVSTPLRELYIDPQTRLPICTRLFRSSGALEAAYWWEDVDTHVHLTDGDFLLAAERARRGSTGSKP